MGKRQKDINGKGGKRKVLKKHPACSRELFMLKFYNYLLKLHQIGKAKKCK
jgi:hypothetical protein